MQQARWAIPTTCQTEETTMQVAVAGAQSRNGNKRNRVTFYEEQDIELITDAELAELCRLCRLAAERTISMTPDRLTEIIDSLGPGGKEQVFM